MKMLAVLLLMVGGLLVWSAVTNGSITGMLASVLGSSSTAKKKK